MCANAAAVSAPSPDGRAAYLGDVTRHCLAAARRRGTAHLADVPEELLEAAVLVYLRGLGLPAAKGAGAI